MARDLVAAGCGCAVGAGDFFEAAFVDADVEAGFVVVALVGAVPAAVAFAGAGVAGFLAAGAFVAVGFLAGAFVAGAFVAVGFLAGAFVAGAFAGAATEPSREGVAGSTGSGPPGRTARTPVTARRTAPETRLVAPIADS